jgi:protein SCO1/2
MAQTTDRSRVLVPLLLALVLAAALGWLLWPAQPAGEQGMAPGRPELQGQHRQLALASAPTGGDFRLHGKGGPVALADFRGKVVLLYFGYTWCPDICPTNLAIIAQALKGLTPAERARVQVLFVSVDPARDDLNRLAEYAAYWDPAVLGITGSDAEVAAAARRYGAAYRRTEQSGSAMGYLVDHSASTYVIGPDGRLLETLVHATPPASVVASIRRALGTQQ